MDRYGDGTRYRRPAFDARQVDREPRERQNLDQWNRELEHSAVAAVEDHRGDVRGSKQHV